MNLNNYAILPLLLDEHAVKNLSWRVPSSYPVHVLPQSVTIKIQISAQIAQSIDPFMRRIFMCIVFVFWFSVFPFLRKLNPMLHLKALNKDLFIYSLVLFFHVSDLIVRSSATWFSCRFLILWTSAWALSALTQLLGHWLLTDSLLLGDFQLGGSLGLPAVRDRVRTK